MFLRNLKKTVTSSLEPPQLNKADITLYILLAEIQWLEWIQAFGSGGQAIAVVEPSRCTVCMCILYLWNIYNFASPKFSNIPSPISNSCSQEILTPELCGKVSWSNSAWRSSMRAKTLEASACGTSTQLDLKGHGGTTALGKNQPSPYPTFHTRPFRNVRV